MDWREVSPGIYGFVWIEGSKDPLFVATPELVDRKAKMGQALKAGLAYERSALDVLSEQQLLSYGVTPEMRALLPVGYHAATAEAILGEMAEQQRTQAAPWLETFFENAGADIPDQIGLLPHQIPQHYP